MEGWTKVEKGETVILRELPSCQQIKSHGLYYDAEEEKVIEGCYGPTEEYPDRMDNFYCCWAEVSPKE